MIATLSEMPKLARTMSVFGDEASDHRKKAGDECDHDQRHREWQVDPEER